MISGSRTVNAPKTRPISGYPTLRSLHSMSYSSTLMQQQCFTKEMIYMSGWWWWRMPSRSRGRCHVGPMLDSSDRHRCNSCWPAQHKRRKESKAAQSSALDQATDTERTRRKVGWDRSFGLSSTKPSAKPEQNAVPSAPPLCHPSSQDGFKTPSCQPRRLRALKPTKEHLNQSESNIKSQPSNLVCVVWRTTQAHVCREIRLMTLC
jgi:hypothetical protein